MVAVKMVEPRPGDWTLVSFPYDASAVALLKDVVPYGKRMWKAGTKEWMVAPGHAEPLAEAFIAAGHSVGDDLVAPKPPPLPRPPEADEGGSLWAPGEDKVWCKAKAAEIMDSIPVHLRHRTFREFTKLLMPEYGSGR